MRLTLLDAEARAAANELEHLPGALREAGEIAAMRLSRALTDATLSASDKLFDQASQALTPVEREGWLGAADLARSMRLDIGPNFIAAFQRHYARACGPTGNLAPIEPGFGERFRQYVAWDGLHRLSQCFASLLGRPDLDPLDAPAGPRVISAAFLETMRRQVGTAESKQRLVEFVLQDFLSRVNLLYRDLTSFLLALGYVDRRAMAASMPVSEPPEMETYPSSTPKLADAASPSIIDTLAPGMWIEYRKPGKAPRPLKLAWVSPKRGMFLWCTAEGGRTLGVSADKLAAAFASGHAVRIEPVDAHQEIDLPTCRRLA
jgi:hypothetical protein